MQTHSDVLIVKTHTKCTHFLRRFWCNGLKTNISFKKSKSKEYEKKPEKTKKKASKINAKQPSTKGTSYSFDVWIIKYIIVTYSQFTFLVVLVFTHVKDLYICLLRCILYRLMCKLTFQINKLYSFKEFSKIFTE